MESRNIQPRPSSVVLAIVFTVIAFNTECEAKNDFQEDPLSSLQWNPMLLGTSPETEREAFLAARIQGRGPFSILDVIGDVIGIHDNSPSGKTKRKNQIRYLLKHQTQPAYIIVKRDASDITSSGVWATNGKVKVIIHGFTSSTWKTSVENIAAQNQFAIGDAYARQKKDYNIIVVDWTSLSTEPLYLYHQAAASTYYAGVDVAEFLIRLKDLNLISSWDDVHVIGHSLGSHVSGVVGHTVQKSTGSKVGRITGVDPAGPSFDEGGHYPNPEKALDKEDAQFVDIMHCNMGILVAGKLGTTVQSGHADFYPNGGSVQSGCEFMDVLCSHVACTIYFERSISESLLACPCDSWTTRRARRSCLCTKDTGGIYMGDKCETTASGKYYIRI